MGIYFIEDDFGLSGKIFNSELITEAQFLQNINVFNSCVFIFKDPKYFKYKDIFDRTNSSFFYINSILIQPYNHHDQKKYFYKINQNSYFDLNVDVNMDQVKIVSKQYHETFKLRIDKYISENNAQPEYVVPTDDKLFKINQISKDIWLDNLKEYKKLDVDIFQRKFKKINSIISNDVYFAFRNYISGVDTILYNYETKEFSNFKEMFKDGLILETVLSSLFIVDDFEDGRVSDYLNYKISKLTFPRSKNLKISGKLTDNVIPSKKNVELINLEIFKERSKNVSVDGDTISCFYDGSKAINRVSILSIYKSYKKTRIFDLKNPLPDNGIIYVNGPKVVQKHFDNIVEENRRFLFLDNFYLDDDSKYRIVYNHIHPMKSDYIDFKHNQELLNWKQNDSYILLCPPTGELIKPYGISKNWLRETVSEIREKTNREIKIRFKSLELVDENKKNIDSLLENFYNLDISKDLVKADLIELIDNSYAVVAPASGVCVKAAIRGIPVFSEPFGPTADISLSDYSKINEPISPDRDAWLNKIMVHEFSLKDISTGEWLLRLKKIYPELEFIDEKNINTF